MAQDNILSVSTKYGQYRMAVRLFRAFRSNISKSLSSSINTTLRSFQLIISIAAGITTSSISRKLSGKFPVEKESRLFLAGKAFIPASYMSVAPGAPEAHHLQVRRL